MRNGLMSRNLLVAFILSAVTCGIYDLYLITTIPSEFRQTNPERRALGGFVWLLLAIILAPFMPIILGWWTYTMLNNIQYTTQKIGDVKRANFISRYRIFTIIVNIVCSIALLGGVMLTFFAIDIPMFISLLLGLALLITGINFFLVIYQESKLYKTMLMMNTTC